MATPEKTADTPDRAEPKAETLPGAIAVLTADDAKTILTQLMAARAWIDLAIGKLDGPPAHEAKSPSRPESAAG